MGAETGSTAAEQRARAEGALTGLGVGEVLGAETEGLSPAQAVLALQSAFPDLAREVPGVTLVQRLLGESTADPGDGQPERVAGLPGWVAVAVAGGITQGCDPVEDLADEVGRRLDPTDQDRLTRAGASAVAAAVSAARVGSPWATCLSLAISAADAAESDTARPYGAGPSLAGRLAWAHALATRSTEAPGEVIGMLVGTADIPQEAVPAAFAVVGMCLAGPEGGAVGNPAVVARRAAELGGRATVVAALAGALAGALTGVDMFPVHMRRTMPA